MKIASRQLLLLLSPAAVTPPVVSTFRLIPRVSIIPTTTTFAATITTTIMSSSSTSNNNTASNNNNNAENVVVPKPPPRVDSVERVASTKWLALNTLNWTDQNGVERKWDVATRTTKKDPTSTDAVCIIPMLRHEDGKVETVLVEQFRPPVRQTTIEFPAGLIDDGETPEQAALRELREETGYVGEACQVVPAAASRPVCMSPGLTDETIQVVVVEVDMSNPYNINPKPELDDGEHVTVRRVGLDEGFKKVLDSSSSNNNNTSSSSPMPLMGLYLFAIGLDMGRKQQQKPPAASSSK